MENESITNRDFIVFGMQGWDIEIGCNPRNISLVMANNNNRVLYINKPIDRITYLKGGAAKDKKLHARVLSWKKGIGELEEVKKGIHVLNPRMIYESTNFLPQGKLYNFFNRLNGRRLAKQINKALKTLQFKNPIIFIDDDFVKGFYLKDLIPHDISVYYLRDFLIYYPYFDKRAALLPALIKKSDVVVGNSLYFKNYCLQFNPNSFDIGQGCETGVFQKETYPKPDDMKNIPGPIIGYCGALLYTRLDVKLLEKIAKQKKEWSFVLVGKEDNVFAASALHQLPNVYFLGPKNFEDVPAYIHFFDVCINPQIVNMITIGNYPLKIDEYLAAGKPVVATDTEAMQMFSDYCYLGKTPDEYIHNIDKALNEPDAVIKNAERRKFAQSHSWEASVDKIYAAIQSFKKQKV